jgi:nucleoside phosphorylase
MIYYELAKQTEVGLNLRPDVYRASPFLLSAVNHIASQPTPWISAIRCERPDGTTGRVNPKVHVGPILSGDKVVATKGFLAEFRKNWTNIVGVEMEGAASGLAVYRSETRPEFLLIKGICDWADSAKDDRWQSYAAHAAAALSLHLLETIESPSLASSQ